MIEMIVAALTAGAIAAAKDTAAQVVKDGYNGLKKLVLDKLTHAPNADDAKAAVTMATKNPDSKEIKQQLAAELSTAKLDQDAQVKAKAQEVNEVLKQHGHLSNNTITNNSGIAIQSATVNGDVFMGDKIGRDKIGTQINH